jgi:uncharacterized protein (DUF433 family)
MKKIVTAATLALALVAAPAAGIAAAAERPPRADAPHAGRRLARVVGVAADAIGISARDLAHELREGKSVAEVAEAHDVDPAAVADAIVAAATERIDAAVDAGKLDADRAATLKGNLDERVTRLLDREPRRHAGLRARRAAIRRHARRAALGVAAGQIGVGARDLGRELREGKSVAEVARAHDVDPARVVDAIVATATKRIDAALEAGKIDADRAATMKERLPERAERFVNRSR